MHGLTKEQINFLNEHRVHLKFVFNAKGMSKSKYRPIMKELNKYIAYNVTPCKKSGHTLRTRSGHCCQCNTAHMAFQKRNDSVGVTYIAGSLTGNVIKIGFTKAVEIRSESLNRTNYAGFNDWKVLFALKSKNAGRIETRANSLLNNYAFSLDYEHDGHWQDSHETFHCSYSKAKKFVKQVCSENNYDFESIRESLTEKYEFRILKKDTKWNK
ncbi:GIY-YIG nuclease family protein [Galbibacter sp. EGI 63066]|uniref:GIY-YIG nuclease family protein n=1 Tax=Galbibacter sp. EGI 63066 TaxID=2993559 RepID=UPI002248A8A2|nr:GIY-YIG nuclease family protein [Galbibacter sp. EGI 63066]MCX2680145.1 GIY-YIG nuclease family protein [Galbibacter sp. EGI 63066]